MFYHALPCFTVFYHVYQPWKCGATSWSVVHRTSKIILSSNLACLWLSIWITVGMGMMKTIIPVISEVRVGYTSIFTSNQNGFPIYSPYLPMSYVFSPWKMSHIFPIYVLCSILYFPYISHIFPIYFPTDRFVFLLASWPSASGRRAWSHAEIGLHTYGQVVRCLQHCFGGSNWEDQIRKDKSVNACAFIYIYIYIFIIATVTITIVMLYNIYI